MLVTLIGKSSLSKVRLPREKMGNYWLYDKDHNKRLISIEATEDDEWEIKSSYLCKIINPKNILFYNNTMKLVKNSMVYLDSITLEDYNFYYVTIGNSDEIYILYCSPIYETDYLHLRISNISNIEIGRSPKCQIVYDNPLVYDVQAKITFFQGVWSIENFDRKYDTFVNDKPVSKSTVRLYNGDRVSIFGLNIIIINKEIYINNPLNKVKYDLKYFLPKPHSNNKLINSEDEENFSKYFSKRYFLRTPRIMEKTHQEEISIAPPSVGKKNRELPAAVVLATSFSMSTMTLITLSQTIMNLSDGKIDMRSAIFSFAMSGAMLLTSVLIPILNRVFSKRIQKLNRKDAIEGYKKYIRKKELNIENILNDNRKIINDIYPPEDRCLDIILNQSSRLWERQITDEDFLTLRIGIGDVASNLKVSDTMDENIDGDQETFDLMKQCIAKAKILKNSPVLTSLTQNNIMGLICQKEELKNRYIQNLLLQLVTFQSYDELKIVMLLNDNSNGKWNFVKMLPHLWSNSREMRFFADTSEEIGVIAQFLEDEFRKRNKQLQETSNDHFNYKDSKPYYLIIADDYKSLENLPIINDILKSEQNFGFSLLFIGNSILNLPNECKHFIDLNGEKGALLSSEDIINSRINFEFNLSEIFSFEKISQILSNILIKYNDEKEMMLPSNYTFLEMYNVGCIEQLHIFERWRENDTTVSLSAPVGIDGAGKIIALDIHEKFHGPHGLIAGSTGSGKSEFIVTYILSLAINYHPDDVTFVLIDYKGGGLAGAFKRPDIQLPHLVGTITNIDKSSLQRSLESIESELKARQIKFSMACIETGESTMDIYKYQKYYHNGILKEPISHLFIISDEFAELKQQEPEFMDELISIARIGRSLGVHLILATQKPAGVVNDQIRSNTKFGVCLKVQTPSDSKDIIGISDASKLTSAGQFYLKVGNDDYLVLGQSAWSGALYYPSNEVRKEFDNSIEFISSTGRILKKVDDIKKTVTESKGEQLANIVKYICELAKMKNISEKPLWLPPIPENIYLKDIRNKYKVKNNSGIIAPVLGEYDNPSKQLQNVYKIDLTYGGNVIIYGNAVSGKEELLNTMIYDIITQYSSDEVWMYILDFGGETMKIFKQAAHVGDVVFSSEKEKITRLFVMLQKEVKDRKEILSKYNGDYNLYLKHNKEPIPLYTIIINNYESFVEIFHDAYNDIFEYLLREGLKYRIVFIFSTSTTSTIRYRMLQNFKQKITLQMNKEDDYRTIFERLGNKVPSNIFGRGIINPEDKEYYEFQTAKICKPEDWNSQITSAIEKINKIEKVQAKEIEVVPDIVTIKDLLPAIKDISSIPVGISYKTISPFVFDLTKYLMYPIITNSLDEFNLFLANFIELISSIPDTMLTVLDSNQIVRNIKQDLKADYIEVFKKFHAAKKKKEQIILIIGLENFLTELGSEDIFFESMKDAERLEKIHYVVVETSAKMNNFTISKWYKKYLTGETGFWLGNGVNEQYLLKSNIPNVRLSSTCGISYGYAFAKGKPYLVKILGMKESSEENE